ncbi:hypothetical protein P7C73_g3677, partial [Tremellales sp. Uapishka_1]
MSRPTALTAETLAADLSLLSQFPPAKLAALLFPSTHFPPTKSAINQLDSFSPNTATVEDSQTLISAYIRDMRNDVLGLVNDQGQGEMVGERLDSVREKASEIAQVLSEVKI